MDSLPLRVVRPEFLLLLVLVPWVWWMARRSLAGLGKVRQSLALALRIVIVLCLILACTQLQWQTTAKDVAVYFLLDWSDSIPSNPPDYRTNVLDYMVQASDHKEDDDQAGLIYFGAEPTCEQPPSPTPPSTERQAVVDVSGTDIASAIRLALFTFPPGVRKRIVLATDGNQNRGNALAEAEAARQQGVQVDVLPVEYTHDREIVVEKVILPDSIQENVPFKVKAVVRSTHATEADLTLRRGGASISTHRVALQPRRNVIGIPATARSDQENLLTGVVEYTVEAAAVRPADDHIGGNNAATGFSRVHGPPTVLYIDGNIGYTENYEPRLHAELTQKLHLVARARGAEDPEVRLHLVTAADIPDIEQLAGYDCVILDNVPAEALQADRMERLRALVNDQGVGLVMIGGERSFGAGNYLRTPVEAVLPVDMDLKHKKVMPNGALAIILHTCEFGNGNFWAKVITKKAIDTLGINDYVGVLCWGAQGDQWAFKLQRAINRVRLKKIVDRITPMDMPSFGPTMKMAVGGLLKTPAAVRHIIVISDGDPTPPSMQIQNTIRNTKNLTLSAIGIGVHAAQFKANMQRLARMGGGRYYDVKDPKKLPRIFVKEAMVVKKSLIFEDPFTPVINQRDSLAFVEKVMGEGLPQLYGYVATTAKPAADVPLIALQKGEKEEQVDRNPILAHWRYGLGQAVAFTSDAKNRWGKDWLVWDRFGDFWAEVVYRILRQQPSNLKLNAEIEGERGRIVVQALDEDGNPLSFLDLTAAISTPSNESLRVRLRQTGVCTYEGEFPARDVGAYQVAVRTPPDTPGPKAAAYGGVSVPHSAEMERLSANTTFLHRLAEKGGGRVLHGAPERDGLFDRDLPAPEDYEDWWPWLLLLAAILFPFDVFVRRVMIDWAAAIRWTQNRYRAWRGKPLKREERMDRLMQAKQEALRERARPEFIQDEAEADFDLSGTAGAPQEKPQAPAAPTPAAEAPSEEPPEQTYTGRLLKAKQRAMKDRDRRE